MPELPEVETVRRGLEPVLTGERITNVVLNRPDLRFPFPKNIAKRMENQVVNSISRRAKYLLFHLNSGDVVLIHLGMSGRILLIEKDDYQPKMHDHVLIDFGLKRLIFNDARRFGMMDILHQDEMLTHALLAHLGPEPLGNEFHSDYLAEKCKNSRSPSKSLIMNQKVVVGVGNIYACEALFRSRINPFKPLNGNKKQMDTLVSNIRNVLQEAIASGGSTLRDYVRSSGDMGYFQHSFEVYGREEEACVVCGTTIKRAVQSGRSTFYCPKCQLVK